MVSITGTPNGTGSQAGVIDFAGDTDSFNIFLRGGELYEFRANATGSLDPTLTVHRPIGADIFNDDIDGPNNRNSRILFRPGTTTARHTLEVAGFNGSIGGYQLVANEVPGDNSTYSNLSVNSSNFGDLHANGDQDFHRITLTAGHTYRFNLDGVSFGSGALANPSLELRNTNGSIQASNDDANGTLNSQLTVVALTGGTYFANARAFDNVGTGGYRLTATQIA
jgi:hypothetical protein